MPPTRNPWKADRTSGASSGGAAVAVAVGAGPLAHGSDGAGSIRIPAALCGVFGLKPSFGRVPYWPNADIWAARSHSGPITRTVRDAGLLLGVLAGPDPRDPLSLDATDQDYLAACEPGELTGLKVAWSADFGYASVDSDVREVAEASARRFAELGCTVESVDPGWDDPAPWAEKLWHMNMAARFSDQLDERPEWIEPSLRTMIEAGRRLSGLEVGRAQVARNRVLQPGAAVYGTLRPAAHAANAVRGLARRTRVDGRRRVHLRSLAIHLSVQWHRLASGVGAVRLQR